MDQRFSERGESNRNAGWQQPTSPRVTVTVRTHGSEAVVVSVSPGGTVRDALETAGFQARNDWEVWLDGMVADFTTRISPQKDSEIVYRPKVASLPVDPQQLVDFIVWYATTRREFLTPIRLVKFLYLLDLYYARQANGQTLTGWPWAFIHYGPFCGRALDAIESAVQKGIIEARPYQSRYDGEQRFVYRSPHTEKPKASDILPLGVLMPLEAAIRRWGGDTAALLDHIYFETEPMLAARPGQLLDFSVAQQPARAEPMPMLRLRPDRVAEGKQLLARLRACAEKGLAQSLQEAQGEIRDKAYQTFLEQLERHEPLPSIKGTATITPPDQPESEDQP